MSYSATVTLGSSYTGNTNIDNFTIQAIGSNGSTVRTTYATGVTRAALAAGYGISGVEATDTYVRVTSSGTCINSVDFPINTVTPTPTPNSGGGMNLQLIVISSGSDGANACYNKSVSQYTFNVYGTFTYLVDGGTYYNESIGDTMFVGTGGFYSDGNTFGKINGSGTYTQLGVC